MERRENKQVAWYEGNRFTLTESHRYWDETKLDAEVQTDVLAVPDTISGTSLRYLTLTVSSGAERVRELRIPAAIQAIHLKNNLFPNLKQVTVDPNSKNYRGNGAMLCSEDGRTLVYALGEGMKEAAVVPKEIRALGKTAFQDTVCQEIRFENPDIRVEYGDTFQNSAWFAAQTREAIVGNLLFRLCAPCARYEVPKGVRRFHPECFSQYAPDTLASPFPPQQELLRNTANHYSSGPWANFSRQCHVLELSSPTAQLKFSMFRNHWPGLRAIHCPENHKQYRSRDGVLFSADGRTLLFYPPGRGAARYEVPEGTEKIAPTAFLDEESLEELSLPDTVTFLGMGAFCGCRALRQVHFPAHLRELPDAGLYGGYGIFEDCKELSEITLPDSLCYIGSRAFLNSSLRGIHWGTGLEEIGEYALCTRTLRSIALPASLRRVRLGALYYVKEVSAYEGSARGLVSAVNAVPCGDQPSLENLKWRGLTIRVLDRDGALRYTLNLPESLKRAAAYHMELAWNGDSVDWDEFDACFPDIQDAEERLDYAVAHLRRSSESGEVEPYESYFRHNAWKVTERLIRKGEDALFLRFLRAGYLSQGTRSKALKLCGELNRVSLSAYLLEAGSKERGGKTKRSRFVL